MIYIEKNNLFIDNFLVVDESDVPVTGLSQSNFTIKLYNSDDNEVANISGGTVVTVNELGNGLYEIDFTPDELGNWILLIYHTTYFPWGKGQNYTCVDSLGGGVTQEIEDMIKRILGLTQENFRIFDQAYDKNNNLIASTVKIYPSAADVDADTNVIATYNMEAIFNLRRNLLTGYKMKRIS